MIKIYYYNKIIFISEIRLNSDNVTKILFSDEKSLKNKIKTFLDISQTSNINIYGSNPLVVIDYLKSELNFIQAAGGIVKNNANKIIFIYKRDTWDLPKGKIDSGETPETAAVREVSEECGLSLKEIIEVERLSSTFHIYLEDNMPILKETIWFKMKYFGNSAEITAQKEEGISEVKWVGEEELDEILSSTYRSVIEIMRD